MFSLLLSWQTTDKLDKRLLRATSALPVSVPAVTGPHAHKTTIVTKSDHLDPFMVFLENRSPLKIRSMRRAGILETSPDSITASQRLKDPSCSDKSFALTPTDAENVIIHWWDQSNRFGSLFFFGRQTVERKKSQRCAKDLFLLPLCCYVGSRRTIH